MADSDAIKRLLQRLQTGWAPQADEIEPAVPQVDARNWQWNFEDLGDLYDWTPLRPRRGEQSL